MKKLLTTLLLLLVCSLNAFADTEYSSEYYGKIKDMWKKNGKYEEKILNVGYKILNANKLPQHIAIKASVRKSRINAYAIFFDKSVLIDKGILPYFDNDDELAAILSHEIAHTLDMDAGFGRQMAMLYCPVKYETKADLVGLDLMIKAGYDPLAMISAMRKIAGEHADVGSTHPKGSRRLTYLYNYIKKYYPKSLKNSKYKNNLYFVNSMNIIKSYKGSPFGLTTKNIVKLVRKEKLKREKTARLIERL